MAVFPHVRAKSRWTPIQRHLAHQPALHQHTQAVVDRRKRNFRHPPFCPLKYFVRRRMVVAVRHHFENFLPLLRGTKSARLERTLEILTQNIFYRLRNGLKNRRAPYCVNEPCCHKCSGPLPMPSTGSKMEVMLIKPVMMETRPERIIKKWIRIKINRRRQRWKQLRRGKEIIDHCLAHPRLLKVNHMLALQVICRPRCS